MTAEDAEMLGYTDGERDGYIGAEYDAYNDTVPGDVDVEYRGGYSLGWLDGRAKARGEDML